MRRGAEGHVRLEDKLDDEPKRLHSGSSMVAMRTVHCAFVEEWVRDRGGCEVGSQRAFSD